MSVDGCSTCASEAQQAALAFQVQIALGKKQLDSERQIGATQARILESIARQGKDSTKGQQFEAIG